jgi:hypothetical protein
MMGMCWVEKHNCGTLPHMPLKQKESTIAKTERADNTHRVSKQQLLIIEEIYSSIPLAPIAENTWMGWLQVSGFCLDNSCL